MINKSKIFITRPTGKYALQSVTGINPVGEAVLEKSVNTQERKKTDILIELRYLLSSSDVDTKNYCSWPIRWKTSGQRLWFTPLPSYEL